MQDFITLKVVTTGEDVEDRFNVHQPLLVVFNVAIKAVGGGSNRDQFTLEYQDQVLDLNRKIEEYISQFNWTDGTILELVPRPEVI